MNADAPNDFTSRQAIEAAIIELEQRLLGWQLKGEPGAQEFAIKELRNEALAFQHPHSRIQRVILAAFDGGRTVSVRTIAAELADCSALIDLGGSEYLFNLAHAAPVTISSNDVLKKMQAALLSWRHLQVPLPMAGDVELVRGDAIEMEPIDWIWLGWLATGKVHLIAGSPGTGKTTLSLAIAATITNGGKFPCGARAERGDVLIWSGEDDPADSIIPRFAACGGDRSRFHFVSGVRTDDGKSRPFDPSYDVERLVAAARNIKDLKLLIVDPLVSVITGDSHKNSETRRDLQPLVEFAAHVGVAVLGVTHYSKGTAGRDPAERVTGSLAFVAVARLVMATAKPKDAGQPSRLVRAKSNLGPDGGGFEYDIQQVPVDQDKGIFGLEILWGEALEGDARTLISEIESPEHTGAGTALEGAKGWLKEMLGTGTVPTTYLMVAAEEAGYSWPAVRRAQKALNVKAVKQGAGGWAWMMPR